ncbi:cation-channel complex subunit UNC-79 domain-containing protein [Ditylenchus destructor]|uniref:Cation-channel complex subunit UNC-79 domain-containing protein n=1 Tax=Ditylenchus destructor TaxID=166010 RepID=A0AAD4NF73_9BILA|nr:cation-channel complex subunit UNC-79 domain-containing protein [Ditylenchus destructor]
MSKRPKNGACKLNMATRAATFSAKIRTLTDFHVRIACNQQLSNAEIVTTLRYFQQTLVGFLKEVPPENSNLFERFAIDTPRTSFFPNLNYSGLFYGIVNLLDAFPLLTSGQAVVAEAILDTLKALYFFLDRDCIDQMPYLIASQLGVFPNQLDKKIVHLLADCIIPYSLGEPASGGLSIPAVLMLIFQHSMDTTLHTLILESLMARRENIYHDLIAVIAKAWTPTPCQNTSCVDKDPSARKCYDPVACAKYGETAPPISLCQKCVSEGSIETDLPVLFICQPMAASTSTICQNKGCESANRVAVGTCFEEDCTRSHGYVPLRLCQECLTALHSNPIAESHIRHQRMLCAWGSPIERNMIEAVVKLLKETQLEGTESEGKRPKWLRQLEGGQVLGKDIDAMSDERRMLSRFGVWMMCALCPPTPDAPPHAIGYIMSMVFQWFSTTALLPNDSMGSTIEQLKSDFASDWVNMAISNHYETLVNILLPNLPEYAQVGGIWDRFCSKKEQLREGLSKLLSLMPYDVISFETWSRVMPHWLQTISQDVDEDDLMELKVLLCKIFEPDLCPLPFEHNKVYEFVAVRLNSGVYDDMLHSLDWLHLLSRINIRISLTMLLDMFLECLTRLRQTKICVLADESICSDDHLDGGVGPLALEVVMVDVIAQQINLSEIGPHEMSTLVQQHFFTVAALLLQYPPESEQPAQHQHSCQNPDTDQHADCQRCQQSAFLYQVLMHLTEQMCPKDEIRIDVDSANMNMSDWLAEVQLTDSLTTPSYLSNQTSPRNPSFQGLGGSPMLGDDDAFKMDEKRQPHSLTDTGIPKTASVHEVVSKDEFVGVLPSEEVETAMAQATTLTETDVGHETCQIITATTMLESQKNTPMQPKRSRTEFWDTSVGRFRFQLDQLPASLRYIYALLENIDRELDPDVQYFLLSVLKYLCLHCEALNNARREHRGFLIWIQENFFIPKLWTLLRSDYSQVGQLAVPLLIHAITLPCGEEVFWNTVNREFTNDSWEVRFKAVERVYVLAHMVIVAPVKANRLLQTCLSCAFSHLVVSAHDPNPAVAQRAILAIKSMPASSKQVMCICFEAQFDSCILDRPLIISRINLLTSLVPEDDAYILTWDFFIQRFETLALEAQLKSHVGDSTFVQDLLHTDPMSELYQRKVNKARQSLNEAERVRSIVKSLRDNSLKHQLTMNSKIDRVTGEEASSSFPLSSSLTPKSGMGNYSRLREFTDEESNLCLLLNRVVDMENTERHTVYLTMTLFVRFLCNKKCGAADEKASAKKQSVLFRYFNTLLGFSNSEKCFTIPPNRLRKAAVCTAFLTGLPEILDNNLMIGNQLLVHLPSPQKFASDQSAADYSLQLLDQPSRHSWLHTLILILYKYRCDTPQISNTIEKLILIVIATLECQCHVCEEKESASDYRQTEFSFYSASSDDESGVEETQVIEEEEDDAELKSKASLDRLQASSGTGPFQHTRPETLKVSGDSGTQQVKFTTASSDSALSSKAGPSRRPKKRNRKKQQQVQQFQQPHSRPEFIDTPQFPWHDTNIFVPGNSKSTGKQLIRVILHQLSSSGIALQLFDSKIPRNLNSFWATLSYSLSEFTELNPVSFMQCLLDDVMESWPQKPARILHNLAAYIVNIPNDSYLNNWAAAVGQFDTFFRRYHSQLVSASSNNNNGNGAPAQSDYPLKSTVTIMTALLRVQNFSTFKSCVSLVESYSKWLAEVLHYCRADLRDLMALCTACNRGLIRERDKQCVARAVVCELIQAIKFKCELAEKNYVTIVELILQDYGEEISEQIADVDQFNTGASEAVRPFMTEILEFIADLHILSKLKKQTNSDRIGGDLKAGLSEVIALEMSRPAVRDSRTVMRFIPWLYSPPSMTSAPPGAFAESVTNVRILSWILVGALHASQNCLPVPISCTSQMADYIHFVLTGFADQSKLWTIYCERVSTRSEDFYTKAMENILDFWSRVTPAILQLLSHSKVLADMVNLHFVNTMQALQQCNSAVLCQLYPMWQPVLTAYHAQIPSQLRIKLDACENQPLDTHMSQSISSWLKKVRYKISQIELQTSAASPFYNV